MQRYKQVKVKKDEDGNRYRVSTTYPSDIPRSEDDLYIYVRGGERLDNLAAKYYKDTTLWWIIALANNIGKGSLFIPAATRIRIPHNTSEYIRKMR